MSRRADARAAGATRAPRAVLLLGLLAVLVGAPGSVLVLTSGGDLARASTVASAGLALVAVPAGAHLLRLRCRVRRSRRLAVTLVGAAVLGYGVAQAASCVEAALGLQGFPGPGDLLSVAVVPLLLVGLTVAPSVSSGALPVVRLLVDGALVGTVVALCLWELVVPHAALDARTSGPMAAVVLAIGVAGSLPLLAAVRDSGRHLWLVAVPVVLLVSVDLSTSLRAMGVDVPPAVVLLGMSVQLFLPVVVALAVRAWALRPSPGRDPLSGDTDALTTTVTSCLVGGLLVLVLVAGGRQTLDPAALAMVVAVVLLVLGREVLLVVTHRRLLDRLTRHVMTDPLTGLSSALALRRGTDRPVSGVVVLDIGGLDSVNQVFGRAVGDELVQAVAHAVAGAAPGSATCFRIGGDELAVVCPAGSSDDALDVAVAVAASVSATVRVGGADHGPRVAVGVARAAGGSAPLATVLEDAVASLHSAQKQRSPVPVVHDEAQTAVRQRRTELEHRLPGALASGAVTVLAQPLVDLASGRVVGVEALARWHDERLGAVSPLEFVEVAEQTGAIDALGEHVLRTAVQEAAAAGLLARGLRLSVNVSPLQLRSARLVHLVGDLVRSYGLRRSQLTLEVTESVLLDEDGPALQHLHALVALGAGVAIDDFGAGHASLGYLRRVPAHVLKLDRSLVSAAGTDPRARAVVHASLELCLGLGMLSVVEGVETSDVAADMTALGADMGQGWLWSPAVPFAAVTELLERQAATTAR